jgi:hypothetical protein
MEAVMAESERDEAKRRRADARRRRRGQDDGQPERGAEPEPQSSDHDEALDTVKHAAKVAAAAAAVGAAVGAARAIAGDGEHEHEDGDAQPEEASEEREPETREPAAEHEQQQPEREEPQPAAEQDDHDEPQPAAEQDDHEEARPGASPGEAKRVVESAREQLTALLDKEPDSVSGLDRNGDGWLVTLEVVELERLPSSTDVLASYELELDGDRRLVRYRRGRRYYRSQADDEALV